ncbi:hypothetical protein AALB53_08465 [Lachnospiraceae bacterium 47-T17]
MNTKKYKSLTITLCVVTATAVGMISSGGLSFVRPSATSSTSAEAIQTAKREFLEMSRKQSYSVYAGSVRETRDALIAAEEKYLKQKTKEEQEKALQQQKADREEQLKLQKEERERSLVEETTSDETLKALVADPESYKPEEVEESANFLSAIATLTGKGIPYHGTYTDRYGDSYELDASKALLTSAVIDKKYISEPLELSSVDRANFERLVQGEAGDEGFAGAAIVAQSLRDNMRDKDVYNLLEIKRIMKYSGSMKNAPNKDVKKACKFILDDGGMALQHRVLYFYAPKWTTNHYSKFHESQLFLIEHKGHRVFDRK